MKPYLKAVKERLTEQINTETGEILDSSLKIHEIVVDSEKDFFLMYSHILGILKNLTGAEIKLLTFIMFKHITPEGYFCNTKLFRESVVKNAGIAEVTVLRSLKGLLEQKIIFKGTDRGVYYIHPQYLWKGTSNSRNKQLNFILKYERDNSL